MKILFNLMTTIEIPDADKFPPREEAEKDLREFFECEGMIVHGLEVTNYCVPGEEESNDDD